MDAERNAIITLALLRMIIKRIFIATMMDTIGKTLETEIVNFSTHPTEISVEIYLIGYTSKKRDYYLMAKSSQPLKLRANESHHLEVFSKAEGSYKKTADDHDGLSKEERAESRVYFRGFVVVARHGKDVVTFIGSDQRLTEFGNPEAEKSPLGGLPVF